MLLIRRILQVAFGLVALAVLFTTLKSPTAHLLTNIAFIGFFVLIILVLGPWWPSADKAQKWKLSLPTDDPKVAFPLLVAALAVFSFFQAWEAYSQPNPHFHRFGGLARRRTRRRARAFHRSIRIALAMM